MDKRLELLKRTQENEKLMKEIEKILNTPQVKGEVILQRIQKITEENKQYRDERNKLLEVVWDNLPRQKVNYKKGNVNISSICLTYDSFLCKFSQGEKKEFRLMEGSIWEFMKNLEQKGFVKEG